MVPEVIWSPCARQGSTGVAVQCLGDVRHNCLRACAGLVGFLLVAA